MRERTVERMGGVAAFAQRTSQLAYYRTWYNSLMNSLVNLSHVISG